MMTNMNELKEHKELFRLASLIVCDPHDEERYRQDLLDYITTYTAKKELEARIDELELAIHAASDIYHHKYTMRVQMIENRISQLKHQLSSQLTNNKEGIEK